MQLSRFTDPGRLAWMLDDLPESVIGVCQIAQRQTIHHNLLGYYGLAPATARAMRRVSLPRLSEVLGALLELPPGTLFADRAPEQRVVGACMLEAHLLAGLLRSKHIPTRIRAGYFKDIRANSEFIVSFWRDALRTRGVNSALLDSDPNRWRESVDAVTRSRNAANHYIEHWVCEYWDHNDGSWRLLDSNNDFLKAHSDLDVGFHLPPHHFEFAFQAWKKMRTDREFNPDQYAEEPQDGRSHIRSQLLWDFYSLLNHDIAAIDEPASQSYAFIKLRTYQGASTSESLVLDDLAKLLDAEASPSQLVDFYHASPVLRLSTAESDPYSLVFAGPSPLGGTP